jgi:hypothetical protein
MTNRRRPARASVGELRIGSFSTKLAGPCHVRYFPDSDRTAGIANGLVRAGFGPSG